MRAGWLTESQFVYSQHCKSCRALGMSEEEIEAIPNWQTADCFSPIERAVLAYADALTLEYGRVGDAELQRAPELPVRRTDPGVDIHHRNVCNAWHHLAGTAIGVR